MSDGYTNYVSKTALDSMPLTLPGDEVSKTFTGSDGAAVVANSLANEPQGSSETDWATKMTRLLTESLSYGGFDVPLQAGKTLGGIVRKDDSADSKSIDWKKILYAALFVVVGLFIISRGFGMIGEEGENVVVSLGDPSKYPGIGHAIQGIKKRK